MFGIFLECRYTGWGGGGKVCSSRGTDQKHKQIIKIDFRVRFGGGWDMVFWNCGTEDRLANTVDD